MRYKIWHKGLQTRNYFIFCNSNALLCCPEAIFREENRNRKELDSCHLTSRKSVDPNPICTAWSACATNNFLSLCLLYSQSSPWPNYKNKVVFVCSLLVVCLWVGSRNIEPHYRGKQNISILRNGKERVKPYHATKTFEKK